MPSAIKIIQKEDTISTRLQALKQRFPELPFLIIKKSSGGIKFGLGREIGVFTNANGQKGGPRVQAGNVLAGITGSAWRSSYSYNIKGRKTSVVSTLSARIANILETKYPAKFPIVGTLARILPQSGLLERVANATMNELLRGVGE